MLLTNQAAFDSWSARVAPSAAAKLQSITAKQIENESWLGRLASQADGQEFERFGRAAVVRVVGGLQYRFDLMAWLFDSSTYAGIAAKVTAAAADESVDKIVLAIDSPGGIHHGCPECADAIFEARARKEVVAVVDPMAASAGYWLASQASRIVSIRSGWVGSVGSQIMLHSMKRMYDEAGVDIEVIRAAISPNKNLGIPYEPISDEAREERQGWVDIAGEQFLEHIERGRGDSRGTILDTYGKGAMYFTPDAIKRGMVDSIGSMAAELK